MPYICIHVHVFRLIKHVVGLSTVADPGISKLGIVRGRIDEFWGLFFFFVV